MNFKDLGTKLKKFRASETGRNLATSAASIGIGGGIVAGMYVGLSLALFVPLSLPLMLCIGMMGGLACFAGVAIGETMLAQPSGQSVPAAPAESQSVALQNSMKVTFNGQALTASQSRALTNPLQLKQPATGRALTFNRPT